MSDIQKTGPISMMNMGPVLLPIYFFRGSNQSILLLRYHTDKAAAPNAASNSRLQTTT